jgi:hypothetical protein
MALISSWATLNTEVMAWLHRPELTAEVPGFIQLGENRIYRDLRVRQMETALSTAISSGVIAVPTGYLEMKYAYVNGSPMVKLQRKDAEWIYQNYPTRSADGTPRYFAREASNFIFGPYPDSGYTIKGLYYKKLTALSASNTTNWLTDDVPDLILMASLCEAAPWMANDERIPVWERRYALLVDQIQRQDDTEEFSGSPLSMTAR